MTSSTAVPKLCKELSGAFVLSSHQAGMGFLVLQLPLKHPHPCEKLFILLLQVMSMHSLVLQAGVRAAVSLVYRGTLWGEEIFVQVFPGSYATVELF